MLPVYVSHLVLTVKVISQVRRLKIKIDVHNKIATCMKCLFFLRPSRQQILQFHNITIFEFKQDFCWQMIGALSENFPYIYT